MAARLRESVQRQRKDGGVRLRLREDQRVKFDKQGTNLLEDDKG
jgi:hypothetical protein